MKKELKTAIELAGRREFIKKVGGGCAAAVVMTAGSAWAMGAKPPKVVQPVPDAEMAEYAKKRFLAHWNCAQAVLETLGPKYGLPTEFAIKVACPFAAGMWKGKTCGSFTGAYMAIGAAHGAIGKKVDHFAVHAVIDRLKQFDKAMLAEFHTLDCSKLLGENMATKKGIQRAAKKGAFTKVCPKTVVAAVNMVLKIN